MSTFIKNYDIPANVRKQYSKYISLELYDDKLVGKGSKNGDITWHFKDYLTVQWTPASLATQFANLVFTTPEGANNLISNNNLTQAIDINRIMFCSGMFSYKPANNYVKSLYLDVKKAFDEYKTNESKYAVDSRKNSTISCADEIKKFKELLNEGIISQEEFEAKKKQLLNL